MINFYLAAALSAACIVNGKPVEFRQYFAERTGIEGSWHYLPGEKVDDALNRLADILADFADCLAQNETPKK